jgi:integrase
MNPKGAHEEANFGGTIDAGVWSAINQYHPHNACQRASGSAPWPIIHVRSLRRRSVYIVGEEIMPRPNRGAHLTWHKPRKSFYICWYEAGHIKKRATGTTDRDEAEAALAQFIADKNAITDGAPLEPRSVLISDVLSHYLLNHAPHVASPQRAAAAAEALLPYWGTSYLNSITKQSCQAYGAYRQRAAGTVRRELSVLRAAVNYAFGEGKITRTPKVWLPKAPPGRNRWLTRKEAATLLNAARTGRSDVRLYLPLFIILALYTGARKEALLSLRWSQVDLENRRINFARGTETNKRRAHIPISGRLMTFLNLAYARRIEGVETIIHDNGKSILDIGDSKHGSFGSACKRAGLAGVSPHTLRHTCGTWLAQRGVSLFTIGGWLGHSNASTTLLYAHHHPDFLIEASRAQDRR